MHPREYRQLKREGRLSARTPDIAPVQVPSTLELLREEWRSIGGPRILWRASALYDRGAKKKEIGIPDLPEVIVQNNKHYDCKMWIRSVSKTPGEMVTKRMDVMSVSPDTHTGGHWSTIRITAPCTEEMEIEWLRGMIANHTSYDAHLSLLERRYGRTSRISMWNTDDGTNIKTTNVEGTSRFVHEVRPRIISDKYRRMMAIFEQGGLYWVTNTNRRSFRKDARIENHVKQRKVSVVKNKNKRGTLHAHSRVVLKAVPGRMV